MHGTCVVDRLLHRDGNYRWMLVRGLAIRDGAGRASRFAGSLTDMKKLYREFYQDDPFTFVADDVIDLKQIVNTNKCLISLEKEKDKLVIHSAIDNLLKGASGQAVQNMNLMCGFEEDSGLRLKSIVF